MTDKLRGPAPGGGSPPQEDEAAAIFDDGFRDGWLAKQAGANDVDSACSLHRAAWEIGRGLGVARPGEDAPPIDVPNPSTMAVEWVYQRLVELFPGFQPDDTKPFSPRFYRAVAQSIAQNVLAAQSGCAPAYVWRALRGTPPSRTEGEKK